MDNETKILSTTITEDHNKINNLFLEKVGHILKSDNLKINSYTIESRSYGTVEGVSLTLEDNKTLTIRLSD
jgi:hypothetical protein